LEIPGYKIDAALKITTRYISMDAPLVDDEDTKFIDVFVDEDSPFTDAGLMKESLTMEIQRSLSTLTDKERDVINLYYGIGIPHSLTLEEIALKFDPTSERVRQIKEKAIRSLKTNHPGDYHLAVLVCDFEGQFICRVDEEEA